MSNSVLNIILGISAAIVGLLAFADQIGKSKRWRSVKSLPFKIVILLVSMAIGVWATIRKDEAAERSAEASKKELIERLKMADETRSVHLRQVEERRSLEMKELQRILEQVQSQLRPFVDLAKQRYPGYLENDALRKLQTDLGRIEELATRDIAKPPARDVAQATLLALQVWKKRNPNTVIIGNLKNADTPNAEAVFGKIIDLLTKADIVFKYQERSGMSAGKLAPIEVLCHPKSEGIANDLLVALSSFVEGQSWFFTDPERNQNEIEISFRGIPKFSNDGRVALD